MPETFTGLSWHFLDGDARPEIRDGTPLIVGEWLPEIRPIEICTRGYHSSARAIDALHYAPGPWVSLVESGGCEKWGVGKLVASARRAIWCYDAREELRRFARACALEVVHLWNPPKVVVEYLTSGSPDLRIAATPMVGAARDATWNAARAAARAAAWDAAGDDAAWDAARDAARAATRAAAWDAAGAARDAAGAAAWAAAWDAAWDNQNSMLEALLINGAIDRGLW